MTDATNTQVAGTDGASLKNEHHSNNQVLNDGKVIKQIPIHSIQTEGTQTRVAGLNQETVTEYAKIMADIEERKDTCASFPPPVVYFDGTNYWLADGAHRLAAAKQIGCNYMDCEVRTGGQRDALQKSLKANATHGLKRSIADKRYSVILVLRDAEWGKLSDRAIADMCGVDHKTVAKYRAEFSSTGEFPQSPETRLGGDGKWRPATQSHPRTPDCEGSETDEDPESEDPTEAEHQADADDDPEAAEVPDSENPESEKLNATEQEAAALSKMADAIKAAKSKNGKPVVCGKLIQQTLANLSRLTRQLHELGLFKKHDPNLSEMIRDVREAGGLKQVPVKGPAPQPAPF